MRIHALQPRPVSVVITQILMLINLVPITLGFVYAFVRAIRTDPAGSLSVRAALFIVISSALIILFLGYGFGGLWKRKRWHLLKLNSDDRQALWMKASLATYHAANDCGREYWKRLRELGDFDVSWAVLAGLWNEVNPGFGPDALASLLLEMKAVEEARPDRNGCTIARSSRSMTDPKSGRRSLRSGSDLPELIDEFI